MFLADPRAFLASEVARPKHSVEKRSGKEI
jgi:hypothetical protein